MTVTRRMYLPVTLIIDLSHVSSREQPYVSLYVLSYACWLAQPPHTGYENGRHFTLQQLGLHQLCQQLTVAPVTGMPS